MLRLSKLTDYGILLLTHLARAGTEGSATARDLAEASHVPFPTVGKLLKELSGTGFLVSHRGANGGYSLARPAELISVDQVIAALEGPVAITECSHDDPANTCQLEGKCPVSGPWKTINRAIREALARVTLAQLAADPTASAIGAFELLPAPQERIR